MGAADDDNRPDASQRPRVTSNQYWTEQFGPTFSSRTSPRWPGGYYSRRPRQPGPRAVPERADRLRRAPGAVEDNAFYCGPSSEHTNGDSISTTGRSSTSWPGHEGYGRFIPALVMAHEFGHAVQAGWATPRRRSPSRPRPTASPALDPRVADGNAPHTGSAGRSSTKSCAAICCCATRSAPARGRGARLLLRPGVGLPGGVRRRRRGLPRRLRSRPALHPARVLRDADLPPGQRAYDRPCTDFVATWLTEFFQATSDSSGRSSPRPSEPFAGEAPECDGDRPTATWSTAPTRHRGLRRGRPDPAAVPDEPAATSAS